MKRPSAIRVSCGFTLIELAVVVAIIGILASIAYPNYTEYVRRGHRADAQSILMDISQRQRQYFTDNRSYADTLEKLNVTVPATVEPYYRIFVEPLPEAPPPSFVVTATAIGSQVADGDLSINNLGTKTPASKW